MKEETKVLLPTDWRLKVLSFVDDWDPQQEYSYILSRSWTDRKLTVGALGAIAAVLLSVVVTFFVAYSFTYPWQFAVYGIADPADWTLFLCLAWGALLLYFAWHFLGNLLLFLWEWVSVWISKGTSLSAPPPQPLDENKHREFN